MNYRQKIRRAIECPQFGNNGYGEWGALRYDQRVLIKRLLDDLDSADGYILKMQKEKQELIDYLKEREIELKENVRTYEEKLRQTSRESFYYNSYLKTLHRYRAKRELIKEILHKVYADGILLEECLNEEVEIIEEKKGNRENNH